MAVDGEGVSRGGSQRHMENGTVYGGVDIYGWIHG
jgi:hypothetical protein